MFQLNTRIFPETTALLICDAQENVDPVMYCREHILNSIQKILKITSLLDLSVLVTEQYPKGLGHTVKTLDISKANIYEKTLFSGLTDEVNEFLISHHIQTVLLCGYETHICIQQTACDLVEKGFRVIIIADGTSSRTSFERNVALRNMLAFGIPLMTAESITFELVRNKSHPAFKEVSKLAKSSLPKIQLPDIF